ncbi:hypothetical protein P879_11666 [Paragonimus westermani]|uniref:DUF4806 domain-containing protein n=1 Tax=Paragonimus westermani TaxID=34504 RepID=A0A8T0D8F5_9TREM|nr:hypothetical protein P879_11666 [Paragonimus westermani]
MHSPSSARMTANVSSSDRSDSMHSTSRTDADSSREDTAAILELVKGIVLTLSTLNSRMQALETQMARNFAPSSDPKLAVMPEMFRSPARTQEDLVAREAELAKSDVYNVVMKSLARMGGTDVADTVRRLLSCLIHHELAVTTNWTGTGNKRAACDLLLMEVVQDSISSQQRLFQFPKCASKGGENAMVCLIMGLMVRRHHSDTFEMLPPELQLFVLFFRHAAATLKEGRLSSNRE